MTEESFERVRYQRDSLKKIMEKMYESTIGKEHRWNCGLRIHKECDCETAMAREEYEEFLFQEEVFQKEKGIENGMDIKRY
jgi:hypothetical protein